MAGEAAPGEPTLPLVDQTELYPTCRADGACMRVTGESILDTPPCTQLGICAAKVILADRFGITPGSNYGGYIGAI